MFDTRSERVAMWAGNLFFLAAIAFFVTLILLASGTAGAQEYPLTDSLEPDALEEDALEPDALGEDALGIERIDPGLIRQLAAQKADLPIARIPPRPPLAIPMYFCWRCWAWHKGVRGGVPGDDYQWLNGFIYPAVPGARVPDPPAEPTKNKSCMEKKQPEVGYTQ